MANEVENPSQNDPLGSTFLLPRTLEGFPAEKGMELEPIHDFLRSKALNDPTELLEQANALLKCISGDSDFEYVHQLQIQDDNREGTENGADYPQRRRPALGRNRAKFSFKPSQSESVSHVDLSLDIDNLQDPDEFFTAHERLENAEKELKKSRGDTLEDPIQHHIGKAVRRRRPGILEKTVSYKHLYTTFGGKENLVQSQEEKSLLKVPKPSMGTLEMLSSNISHPEAGQPGESQERETAEDRHLTDIQRKGSIAEAENRVNELLNELLFTCKDLDGGEMVSLLQERLQVKPITLDKLSLPDLGSVQRTVLRASQETLSRPRIPLSDLQQVTKSTIKAKTPVKSSKKAGNFRCSPASPTPPRSPFASMSILRKRISQIDTLQNPFDVSLGADVSSSKQPCSIQDMGKQALSPPIRTNQLDTRSLDALGDSHPPGNDGKSSSLDAKLQSLVFAEGNIVGSNLNSGKLPIVDSVCPSDRPTDETTNRFDGEMDIMSIAEGNIVGNDVSSGKLARVDSACPSDRPTNETTDMFDNDINITSIAECNTAGSDDSAGRLPIVDSACPSHERTDETTNRSDNDMNIMLNGLYNASQDKVKDVLPEVSVNPEPKQGSEDSTTGTTVHCSGNQPGTHFSKDGRELENPNNSREQHNKELRVPSITSPNERRKQNSPQRTRSEKEEPARKRSKREARSLRQSLAGAGTLFESGVRRSTRIKSRPLEYWRGERFLYGRIHDSLPTVIGMKYASPSAKEPVLKVKSYVSEEYAELVEIAALH